MKIKVDLGTNGKHLNHQWTRVRATAWLWGLVLAWLAMPAWAFPAALLGRCSERSRTLTLSGSDTAGQERIWNVERNGRRYWSYEGVNYEIPLSDKHKGSFEVTLDSFACSEHTWSDEFAPPFYHILLINSAGDLYRPFTCDDSHGYTHSITPETLNRLGEGGRVVIVVGTAESSGTYFVRVSH